MSNKIPLSVPCKLGWRVFLNIGGTVSIGQLGRHAGQEVLEAVVRVELRDVPMLSAALAEAVRQMEAGECDGPIDIEGGEQ